MHVVSTTLLLSSLTLNVRRCHGYLRGPQLLPQLRKMPAAVGLVAVCGSIAGEVRVRCGAITAARELSLIESAATALDIAAAALVT